MVQKTHTFHVHGMHCAACVVVTESELLGLPHIKHAKSNLHNNSVEIVGNFDDKDPTAIAEELTLVLIKHGYRLSVEKPLDQLGAGNWSDFKIAIPIALAFAVLFRSGEHTSELQSHV